VEGIGQADTTSSTVAHHDIAAA